jgi:hypothetical protein
MLGMWPLCPALSREHRYQTSFPINEQLLIKLGGFLSIGMLETGDPLAGTERNEVSAKNTGILEYCFLENWDVALLEKSLLTCEGEYQEMEVLLSSPHSIIPSFHYSPPASPAWLEGGPPREQWRAGMHGTGAHA